MVGASKILTVSYGTFSCTLEGFDEPFNTMKAIAEYFRDLAADDRYFGAEPPQPDAEMLHRIAEREIQRRVEAKIGANGVVLRPQLDEVKTAAAPAPQAEPAPAPMPAAPAAAAPVAAEVAPAPVDPAAESVAAKLQRIRAAVASARAATQVEEFAEEDKIDEAELASDSNGASGFAESEDFGYKLDISGPVEAEEVNAAEPAPEQTLAEPVMAEPEPTPEPVPAPAFAFDPDAAARRRAARRAARVAVLSRTAAELAMPVAPEPAVQAEAEVDEIVALEDLVEPALETAAPVEAAETDMQEPFMLQAPVDLDEDLPEIEMAAAPLAPVTDPATQPLEAETAAENDEDDFDLMASLRALRSENETAVSAPRAPVEEIAPSAQALPEIEEIVLDLPEDGLTEDLVAEEAAELAEAPEEIVADEAEAVEDLAPEAAAPAEAEYEDEDLAEFPRADHVALAADHDADVSRLMEKADEQLAGRENRRRFSAIAHLKAAVAATVADRRAKSAPRAEDQTGPYRADLSEAVRPRRPSQADAATPRPELNAPRPAPLVLVSAQRIDRDASGAPAPAPVVRPRRIPSRLIANVTPEEEVEFDEADMTPIPASEAASFAEFAEARGAQGLTELLEAAAAFTAQVEGRPHFSPPQVLRKVASLSEGADASREERLRVFGALLRQGKIEKVRRGQYAITKASRYYEESKSA